MKHLKYSGTALFLVALIASGCSGVKNFQITSSPLQIKDLDKVAETYANQIQKEGLLLKFAPGDEIPVEITSYFPFASLESGKNRLVFSQTTYIYLCNKGAYISPDAKRFAPVYDGRAIKKLYPAKTGTFSIGFAMTREDGAKMKVNVSLE